MSSQLDRLSGFTGLVPFKAPVRTCTNGPITLNGPQTVNGVVLSVGDRVLVKDQTNGAENGIYNVKATLWGRSEDFDNSSNLVAGAMTFVNEGLVGVGSGTVYVLKTPNVVLSVTPLSFESLTTTVDVTAAIGVTVQAFSSVLDTLSSSSPTPGGISVLEAQVTNGAISLLESSISALGISLSSAASQQAARALLGISESAIAPRIGELVFTLWDVAPLNSLKATGALYLRDDYSDLWDSINANGPLVSENAWVSSIVNQASFSDGDGATTFRLPDFAGVGIRVLDEGRGLDAGRMEGIYQPDAVGPHSHLFGASFSGAGVGSNGGYVVPSGSNVSTRNNSGIETRMKNNPVYAWIKFA